MTCKVIIYVFQIIYCKNNVCVHPPAVLRSETQHHPGYLNIRSQDDEVCRKLHILDKEKRMHKSIS